MKKFVCILAVIAAVLSFAACGGTSLTTYDTGTGLTAELPAGLTKQELSGAVVFSNNDFMMSALIETNETFTSLGVDPASFTIEDYADLVKSANTGVDIDFKKDAAGNYASPYENLSNGVKYFYYATIRKGTDGFWLINFACNVDEQDTYLPLFEQWSQSIKVK